MVTPLVELADWDSAAVALVECWGLVVAVGLAESDSAAMDQSAADSAASGAVACFAAALVAAASAAGRVAGNPETACPDKGLPNKEDMAGSMDLVASQHDQQARTLDTVRN